MNVKSSLIMHSFFYFYFILKYPEICTGVRRVITLPPQKIQRRKVHQPLARPTITPLPYRITDVYTGGRPVSNIFKL